MLVVREVDQRAAHVDDHELQLVGRVRGDQPAPEPAQQRRLAALAVAEHEEVRVRAGEAHPHRVQAALLDADRDALARRRRRQLAAASSVARQQPDRRRRRARASARRPRRRARRARPRCPRPARPSTAAARSGSAGRPSSAPRPGHVGGQRRGRLARDQRVDRVVQLELEPRAEVVEQRRPDLGPAVGGDDDVHAEAQAGRGELLDLAVEPLELALERLPAVDQQEQVRERRRRCAPRVIDSWPASRNACSRSSTSVRSWRTIARDRLAVELAGDAADVRRAVERVQQAAAEVDRRRSAPAPACGARSAPWRACAAACSCRCAASRRRRGGRRRRRGRGRTARCAARTGGRAGRATARRPSARSRAAPPRRVGEHGVERLGLGQRRHPHLVDRRLVAGRGGSTSTCSSLGPPGALGPGAAGCDRRRPPAGLEHAHRRGAARPGSPARSYGPEASAARNCVYDVGVDLQVAEAGQRRQQVGVGRAEHELGLGRGVTSAGTGGSAGGSPGPRRRPSSSRCEDSSRWMPSERPTRPRPTNRSMNSGRAASSSANSSTITSRSGIGGIDGSGVAARLVGDDVVEVAGLAQHRLAALLLADQRRVHAVDERQVALEVRDQAGHVREPRQVGERRAALVVDEHERELLGRVRARPGRRRASAAARSCPSRSRRRARRAGPCRPRPPA